MKLKLVDPYEKHVAELERLGRQATKVIFQDLFDNHPELKGVAWNHYAPVRGSLDDGEDPHVTPPWALLPECLAYGMALHRNPAMMAEEQKYRLVPYQQLATKLPALAGRLKELYDTIMVMKVPLAAVLGKGVRVTVVKPQKEAALKIMSSVTRSRNFWEHGDLDTSEINLTGEDG